MKSRKRHAPEAIVKKLREVDAELAAGTPMGQVCQKLEVSEQTYYRWKRKYGGLSMDEAKRLKQLEEENGRLKKLVADLSLDKEMLKELVKGNF